MPLPACPWGPVAPLPLPLGPLPAPFRPLSPTPWPACSPTVPRSAQCTWAPCPRPCAPFPCPGPFPAPCPVSRRSLPALRPPLLLLLAPCRVCPGPLPARAPGHFPCRILSPAPRFRGWHAALPARRPLLPGSGAWHPLPLQLRQRHARRPALGRRGADVPVRPGGKGLGGNGLGGLVWVWVGLAWARYFAPSLTTAAAAAAAGEAPVARAGSFPRFRGVLGAAVWPAGAVARLARAAVATPRAPSPLPSAAAAALGDAPGSCAGATPRVSGVPGAAVGAPAWLAGAAVSAPRASGAPSRGGGGRACCLGGGAGHLGRLRLLGRRPGVGRGRPGLPSGGPTSTAASASLRSSRSTGVSPAHSGETGEREQDRRWWRSSRWGEPSESAITVSTCKQRGAAYRQMRNQICNSNGFINKRNDFM